MDSLRRNIELLDENKLIFNFDRGVGKSFFLFFALDYSKFQKLGVKVEGQDYYNCVSAGFLMFRPSIEDYNFYVNTFRAGMFIAFSFTSSLTIR
jgi:hypothetical protein